MVDKDKYYNWLVSHVKGALGSNGLNTGKSILQHLAFFYTIWSPKKISAVLNIIYFHHQGSRTMTSLSILRKHWAAAIRFLRAILKCLNYLYRSKRMLQIEMKKSLSMQMSHWQQQNLQNSIEHFRVIASFQVVAVELELVLLRWLDDSVRYQYPQRRPLEIKGK